jgi:hypothetical protein
MILQIKISFALGCGIYVPCLRHLPGKVSGLEQKAGNCSARFGLDFAV